MEWEKRLKDLCLDNNLEAMEANGLINIISPRALSSSLEKTIKETIPDFQKYQVVVGPKHDNINRASVVLRDAGANYLKIAFTPEGIIHVEANGIADDHSCWKMIDKIFEGDLFAKRVVHTLHPQGDKDFMGEILKGLKSPSEKGEYFQDTPGEQTRKEEEAPKTTTKERALHREVLKNRDKGEFIQKEDLTDLSITLNTAETVDDFLKAIGG